MRKRYNAVVCFLLICLLAVQAPGEVLAQEIEQEANPQQDMAGTEDTGQTAIEETKSEPENSVLAEKSEERLKEQALEHMDSSEPEDNVSGQMEGEVKEQADYLEENIAIEEPESEELPEPEGTMADPEDPGKYRLTGRGTEDFSEKGIRAQAVSHQDKYRDCIVQQGIDVSYHNGTIDWEKVKAAGIEFAIIRVAYRGYENGKLMVDRQALTNMKNANAAGIPIGVYIFSQAISPEEAKQEADFIVKNIKGFQIELPVVFDFEYVAKGVGRLYNAKLSKSAGTDVCKAFCDRVKTLGYTPMVYASKTMYESKTYAADFSQEYPIWMAHYNNSTSYAGEYEYWQYTSKGKVDGIRTKENPYTDLNYRYYNTLRITERNVTSLSMRWDAWEGADSYDIYRRSGNGSYMLLKSEVADTVYTDRSLKEGTYYSYKIYPHGTNSCIGFNTGITRITAGKLAGKGTAFDQVKLTWPKVSGASSYCIERYNSSKKTYANIKTASGKSVSYTDGNRDAATKYKYRMRPYKVVFNGRSYGAYSKAVSVKTKGKVKAKTKSKKLALRKSASKSSKNLGTIEKKGTRVTVVGSSGSWYRLSAKIKGKTQTGYIKKSSIKLTK